jgi:hypothetical protein
MVIQFPMSVEGHSAAFVLVEFGLQDAQNVSGFCRDPRAGDYCLRETGTGLLQGNSVFDCELREVVNE